MSLINFFEAIRNGKVHEIESMLDNGEFEVNHSNGLGITGLLHAATYNQFDTVVCLLQRGADLKHQDNEGWGVLHKAGFLGHQELYDYLITQGADPEVKNNGDVTASELKSDPSLYSKSVDKITPPPTQPLPTQPQPQQHVVSRSGVTIPLLSSGADDMILCPGQGAQTVGMMSCYLGTKNDSIERMFEEACDILGYDILKVIQNGPKEKLDSTEVCQVAVYLTSLASYLDFVSKNQHRRFGKAAGYSLGEYTALVIAGVMDWRDGLRLIQKRGNEMMIAAKSTPEPQAMLSVIGLDDASIDQVCSKTNVTVANLMFSKGRVLSGLQSNIERAEVLAKNAGAMRAIRLSVSGAFHSPYMQGAADKLGLAIDEIDVNVDAPGRVWSNFTAKEYDFSKTKDLLLNQLTGTVKWETLMGNTNSGSYVELAPGKQLKSMMRRIDNNLWKKTSNV